MIINMTPHAIVILAPSRAYFDDAVRKLITRTPVVLRTIAPSGQLLNARIVSKEAGEIDGIPVKSTSIASCDAVPGGEDFYIVSQLYLAAAKQAGYDTSRLLTVGEAVYSAGDIKPVGVLNLNRN